MKSVSNLAQTQFFRDTSGSFSISAAIATLVLVTAVSVSLEMTNIARAQQKLQDALDVAVLTAAKNAGSNEVRIQAGNSAFVENLNFTCNNSPSYSFTDKTVYATTECKVSAMIAGLIGRSDFFVATESEATFAGKPVFMCLHALNYGSSKALIYNNKRGPLTYTGDSIIAPECAVQVNSSSSSALFIKEDEGYTFARHCIYGGVSGDTSQLTPPPDATCKNRLPDPLKLWAMPAPAPCASGLVTSVGTTVTLNPGNYCSGLSVNAQSVAMNPGIYHVSGGDFSLTASGGIIGDGVTIVMQPGSGVVEIESDGEINLKAPASGLTAGFLLIDRNGSTGEHLIKTGTNDISAMYLDGFFYTPEDLMEIFWKRAGTGANEKMLHFKNFGMIADMIDLHGYNQLKIDVPQNTALFQDMFSSYSSAESVRLSK